MKEAVVWLRDTSNVVDRRARARARARRRSDAGDKAMARDTSDDDDANEDD